ncbi:hypothetical protein [Pseudomonas sp. SST3]
MLSGQPIGATIGFGTKSEIITAFTMDSIAMPSRCPTRSENR